MIDWNRKLAAFLHDPPEKAYDYGPRHLERARHYASNAGVAQWWNGTAGQPDWSAAAADRFVFPHGSKIGESLGGSIEFVHPVSGRAEDGKPSIAREDFPSQADAEKILDDALPAFGDNDVPTRFFQVWRLWLHHAVTHYAGQRQKAEMIAYLPADTRIPDASIWHHLSVVSALEATRAADGQLRPAFLLFQLGPVQDFIAQARSTRDLWSGSYLLSWMMAHVMKSLADVFGPDCVIFPSLRGQPLFDWLEQEKLKAAQFPNPEGQKTKSFWDDFELEKNQDLVLTPNLPNRFLALVPADFDSAQIERVFDADGWETRNPPSEWAKIVGACWRWLKHAELRHGREQWDFQVRNFWQITWELWPWQEVTEALDLFKTITLGRDSTLHRTFEVACAIPAPHRDDRCYKDGKLDRGWAWNAHYQLLAHRHDARRQTRNFDAWRSADSGHKDHFSGKEQVIATSEWLTRARKQSPVVAHLFRHDDELGAINLIKRVWHKAYLECLSEFHHDVDCLKRVRASFDSVPAVAAGTWRKRLLSFLQSESGRESSACYILDEFGKKCDKAEDALPIEYRRYDDCGDVAKAIVCGLGLRMAFQGSTELWQPGSPYVSIFDPCPGGFIKLSERERRPSEPSWPLLVPGPCATVSVGIAIGHIKEPLQDMINEAQTAEKRAKTEYRRNALALTLFKRSGEMIRWGTSFAAPDKRGNSNPEKSAALRLLNFVQAENRYRRKPDDPKYEPPISGRFPYRLIELLAPYQQFEMQNGDPDFSRPEPMNAELRKIAEKETEWAISRQCENLGSDRHELLTFCKELLCELEKSERPLCEFYHLFAIEAFIARQGE
jgi:hypothetical protein